MTAVLAAYVYGQHFHDLGAYDLRLSQTLADLGASEVTAIDRNAMPDPGPSYPEVHRIQTYFQEYKEPVSHALASWPVNWECGMADLLRDASVVVYLGKNTDGVACGNPALWQHLRCRRVLAHVPHKANTLIVYGALGALARADDECLPEEMAAVYDHRVWSYDEAHSTWGSRC
jgi:hypothetical protein